VKNSGVGCRGQKLGVVGNAMSCYQSCRANSRPSWPNTLPHVNRRIVCRAAAANFQLHAAARVHFFRCHCLEISTSRMPVVHNANQ
jgi:hypothetical protein